MTKLHELLQQKLTDGLFGIEIETEGKGLTDAIPVQWKLDNDGSLRGRFPNECAEYVLRKPLSMDKAIQAVTALRKVQDDAKAQLDFSFRTSVHVHVNVQQLTFNQYLNMIYTYLLIEEPLVHYCGKERIGNRFCLRLQDAEGLLDYLFMLFRNGYTSMRHINGDAVRYAALNVAATAKYGSLEFRSLKGNMDVAYITTWLKALNNVRDFAMKYDNPQTIHDLFVKSEPVDFAKAVLGDVFDSFNYPDLELDMRRSFSISLELPYNFVDKSKEDAEVLKERKEREERHRIEMAEIIKQEEARKEERKRMREALAVGAIANPVKPIDFEEMIRANAEAMRRYEPGEIRFNIPAPPPLRRVRVKPMIVDDLMNEGEGV